MSNANKRKDLIKTINGEPFVSAAMLLLMNADVAFGHEAASAVGRERAQAFLQAAFQEMRTAGFDRAQILETILAQDTHSDRAVDMSIEAMDLIGTDGLFKAMRAAGFNPVQMKGADE